MTNPTVLHMAKELQVASKKTKAPLWAKIAEMATKSSKLKRTVNLGQIDKIVNDNDIVIIPGKVLGTGNIYHKITLCSFSISTNGAKKLIQAGGTLVEFNQLVKDNPTGKGVKIIG